MVRSAPAASTTTPEAIFRSLGVERDRVRGLVHGSLTVISPSYANVSRLGVRCRS